MAESVEGADADADGAVVVELDEAEAAALQEVRDMLLRPCAAAPSAATDGGGGGGGCGGGGGENGNSAPAEPASLASLLVATGAPLRLEPDAVKGRRLVATRSIAAGETLFVEEAAAFFLCRSPGSDVVYSMTLSDGGGAASASASASPPAAAAAAAPRLLCTLTPWSRLRTLRDTLTLAPRFRGGRAEHAFALLAQLTALGGSGAAARAAWDAVPTLPPGAVTDAERDEAGGDEALLAVPPRAQLLHAVSQCNGFAVALPEEDSPWRRNLLWPLLARLALPSDRERLFDDEAPLSHVTGLFALAALMNHACGDAANVSYADCAWREGADFPTVTMRALRAIAPGEECSICYLAAPSDAALTTAERRYRLLMTYRFACACAVCAAEEPAAGSASDPLGLHFPCGPGLEGVEAFFAAGGRYPKRVE